MSQKDIPEAAESLGVSEQDLAFIVVKAKAFNAQSGIDDPDSGSNPTDDRAIDVLEGARGDATRAELAGAINGLTEEARLALVALAWIGRGDFEPAEWNDALTLAQQRREGPAARYLIDMPLLGDYLEDAAAQMGHNLSDVEYDSLYHTPDFQAGAGDEA